MHVTVIAEPGCTAEGKLDIQLDLVEAAARAGANVFKAQWTSDARLMTARRGKAAKAFQRYYEWLQTPLEWHEQVAEACHVLGMRYACSVYLPGDVDRIAPYVSAIKLASFEAMDPSMHERCHAVNVPYWTSVGMCAQEDVDTILWKYRPHVIFHCVSGYPTPLSMLHLGVIADLSHQSEDITTAVGFSDHSESRYTVTGALAVMMGATYVEAHLKLPSAGVDNPDAGGHAMTPLQFADYVEHIREAEQCRGHDEIKVVQPCEQEMLQYRVIP